VTILLGDEIKDDWMSGTCSKNGRNQKRIHNLVGTSEGKQTGKPGR
jgi:hypothetical protein